MDGSAFAVRCAIVWMVMRRANECMNETERNGKRMEMGIDCYYNQPLHVSMKAPATHNGTRNVRDNASFLHT